MSGRKLGGGRILGNGKGLAPPPPPPPSHPAQNQQRLPPPHSHASPRAASPFAPSDVSTVSSGSHNPNLITPPTSSSPLPDFSQDLAANVSLGAPLPPNTGQLVCPICQEEMMTLLQLNRHIDDIHQELPEVQQDEVKTWFDKQVLKAKRFQPLSLINQTLRGLDVFESNEDPRILHTSGPTSSAAATSSANLASGIPRVLEPAPVDPDDLITKKHWQRSTGGDACTDPTCDRRLGPLSGSVNCRNCGRLFCEEHTMYQMRLAPRTAAHDPTRGYWYRVCETCYKSREGYNDHSGALADHTASFVAMRRARVERQNLEIARLEKRLTKLTQLLASPPEEIAALINGGAAGGPGGILAATLAGQKAQRKAIEQSVVTWEDDAAVARCPFCQQEFGSWTFRRHHCRICGRVVCADPQTGCSAEIGLNVATTQPQHHHHQQRTTNFHPSSLGPRRLSGSEKPLGGQVSVDVRMCRDCSTTIFSKRDVAESIAHRPPDQRAYENLRQFERGIRSLMPSFHRTLLALQPPKPGDDDGGIGAHNVKSPPPTHAQIQEAAKIRKRLMDAFAKYNLAARRLRDLPTSSPTQKKLQVAVHAAASTFLHTHMLPLKSVPQMLRSQSSASSASTSTSGHRRLLSGLNNGPGSTGHLSPLRNGESATAGDLVGDASSVAGSEVSTVASVLESEEKELRERLVVLEEQRFLVQEMVNGARGTRRFEEVGALSGNLEELDREIATVRKQVAGVEEKWEGLYAAGGGSPR